MEHRNDTSEAPATTAFPSRWLRWLRDLGFAAPIMASLVVALLVAGSFRLMQMVESPPPGDRSDGGGDSPGVVGGTRAVPLDRTDIELDRPVDPDLGRAGTAADELRQRGRMGDNDALALAGREGRLGSRVLTRTRQEHQGVPVFAADVVVTTEGDRITQIHGHPAPDVNLGTTTPANDYPATVALASGILDHAIVAEDDAELVIMPVGDGYRLAWLGDVIIDRGPEQVALDTETGAVLHRVPLMLQALDREIYDFALACRDAGVRELVDYPVVDLLLLRSPLVRSETTNGGSRLTERLFDLLGSMHSFLDLVLNRDSFDGSGAALVAFLGVRWDALPWPQCIGDQFNAAWAGNFMLLPHVALDFPAVIGHEITHGLIDTSAQLIYEHQPGALNEALSDAIGVTFAAWHRAGAVRNPDVALRMTAPDWQVRDPSGVARDMRNPRSISISTRLGPYPDHYDDYKLLDDDFDNGGVHINSSVINQGFYLLAEGGPHPRRRGGPVVEGIGAMGAARIFGAAAAEQVLTSNSSFEDARYAFAYVAEALHGSGSQEWVAVHTAMDAIGVPGNWDPPEPVRPTAPPATTPTAPAADRPATAPTAPAADLPVTTPMPPQAASDSASEPEPQGDTPVTVSNDVVVFAVIGGLALLGAAGLMFGLRTRRSPSSFRILQKDRAPQQNGLNAVAAPVPASTPLLPQEKEALSGVLQPEDGSRPILLRQALLSSREGFVIGRDLDICHLELRNPAVSRRHVRLRTAGNAILVEDLNSLRGTRVDGADLRPFEPQTLVPGQTLSIAGLTYRMQRKVESRFRP